MTRTTSALVAWLVRYRTLVLFAAAVLFCIAGIRTLLTYQQLRSDLEELLPKTAPAVSAIDTLRSRLRGLRHLGVVVDTGGRQNLDAAARFIDDLKERIETYPKELVSEVHVDIAEEQLFAETYMLQLMELQDVRKLRKAIEARRDWEVSQALDMSLLDEEEDPPPEIPIQELKAKYSKQHKFEQSYPGGRLSSSDGKTAVLLVQTGYHNTAESTDSHLLERVRGDIKSLGFPDKYAPGMRVGFAADVATRVEELEGLQADLTVSGFIVLALVIGLIVWYFRAWQALFILGIPLLLGAVSAFGLVALPPFNIRHLNSNTAFLGTIIIGNGINSGIILLARFQEERRNSSELQEALTVAMKQTWRPTLAAALAASAAYGSLVFTDFRGFNQFGWIGGLGMLLCWGATMLLAPPLIMILGKRMAKPLRGSQRPSSDKPGFVPRIFLSRPRIVLGVTLLATLLAVVGVGRRTSDWIEYDLSKLRRRDSWTVGERYWGARMDQTLGRYLTPTVVMTNNAQQTRNLKQRFERLAEEGKAGNLIDRVQTAASLLPETRFEAVREVRQIAEALTPRLRSQLDSNDRELVVRAVSDASAQPLIADQLPVALVAGLREKNGRIDRSVLIYPKLGGGTWNAERIQDFADDVRREAEKESKDIKAAGTVLLSSDIAQALRHDGPRATGLSLFAVLCICLIAFRARRNANPSDALARRHGLLATAAVLSLLLGVLLMLGGLAWTGARLNFSNFVALPITFGIAADYSINMLKRYQAEGKLELSRVFKGTGSAVALCSLTTIIGFGSLLVAQNQALFSFGVFAVVGEFTCLFTAVVVLPAVFLIWEQARQQRKAAAEGPLE